MFSLIAACSVQLNIDGKFTQHPERSFLQQDLLLGQFHAGGINGFRNIHGSN